MLPPSGVRYIFIRLTESKKPFERLAPEKNGLAEDQKVTGTDILKVLTYDNFR